MNAISPSSGDAAASALFPRPSPPPRVRRCVLREERQPRLRGARLAVRLPLGPEAVPPGARGGRAVPLTLPEQAGSWPASQSGDAFGELRGHTAAGSARQQCSFAAAAPPASASAPPAAAAPPPAARPRGERNGPTSATSQPGVAGGAASSLALSLCAIFSACAARLSRSRCTCTRTCAGRDHTSALHTRLVSPPAGVSLHVLPPPVEIVITSSRATFTRRSRYESLWQSKGSSP